MRAIFAVAVLAFLFAAATRLSKRKSLRPRQRLLKGLNPYALDL
jgi:hypothetical protein